MKSKNFCVPTQWMDPWKIEPRYYFRLDAFSPQLAKIVFSKKFMKNLDRRQALGNERSEGVLRDKLCHLV